MIKFRVPMDAGAHLNVPAKFAGVGIRTRPTVLLPVIVASQFAGTSLWFAGNAVLPDLQRVWGLGSDAVGTVTSATQLGFIFGTLLSAAFAVPDRFSPRKIFFGATLAGGLCNCAIAFAPQSYTLLLILRFLTGVALAGIYPVGMKIASGWYREGLGNALGYLVGALVLGTAFPHLIRSIGTDLPWQEVLITVSLLAILGGGLMLALVPDGPFLRSAAAFRLNIIPSIFRVPDVRAAMSGYFGHMWELYAFYAFVPVVLAASRPGGHNPLWTFLIVAAGSLGCIGGGIISRRVGSVRIAWVQLFASGLACLCSPAFFLLPDGMFLFLLIVWGIVVVGDSPQFSALIARSSPPEYVGSALTIGNSIGFAITIVSIMMLTILLHFVPARWLLVFLAPGPAVGLWSLRSLLRKK